MADRIDIQALREAASKATKGHPEVRDAGGRLVAVVHRPRETILALCAAVEAAQKLIAESDHIGLPTIAAEDRLRTALQPFKKD